MARTFEDEFPNGSNGKRVRPKVDTPEYILRIMCSEDGSDAWGYCADVDDLNERLGEECISSDMTIIIYRMSEIYAHEGTVLRAELT